MTAPGESDIKNLENSIKEEILRLVLDSNGDFTKMSLDKLEELFPRLISLKKNMPSPSLEDVLFEDELSMRAIEERMRIARLQMGGF